MDPEAVMKRYVDAIDAASEAAQRADADALEEHLMEARDAAIALTEWLRNRGFAPKLTADFANAAAAACEEALACLRGET